MKYKGTIRRKKESIQFIKYIFIDVDGIAYINIYKKTETTPVIYREFLYQIN